MIRKVMLAATLALSVLTLTNAGATPNTKLDIVKDCDPCGPRDMVGPTGYGFVNTNQDDDTDALRVVVSLKNATPDQTFNLILYCGPTHATAGNEIALSSFTTNSQGNANTGDWIISASGLASACGTGNHVSHVDVQWYDGALHTWTATGIPWTL